MKRVVIAAILILFLPHFVFAETNDKLAQANEWLEKGNKYSSNGEHEEATSAYTKAIELNPDFAEAYYNRGNAYSDKDQYDTAIADYSKNNCIRTEICRSLQQSRECIFL